MKILYTVDRLDKLKKDLVMAEQKKKIEQTIMKDEIIRYSNCKMVLRKNIGIVYC